MSKEEHEDNEDEDDWMKYANAGFGQTDYSLWDETEQPPTDDEDDSSLDQPQQLGTHMEEEYQYERKQKTMIWARAVNLFSSLSAQFVK